MRFPTVVSQMEFSNFIVVFVIVLYQPRMRLQDCTILMYEGWVYILEMTIGGVDDRGSFQYK